VIIDHEGASGAGLQRPAPDVARFDHVSKAFGATQAVDQVSLSIYPGEVFGLVGENGAGKSTLAKMLAGVISPDSGAIVVNGIAVDFRSPFDAIRAGVAMMAQEINLVPGRSIEENVLLGNIPRRGPFPNRKAIRQRYLEVMEKSGFSLDPKLIVGNLRIADQQKVELFINNNLLKRVSVVDIAQQVPFYLRGVEFTNQMQDFIGAKNSIASLSDALITRAVIKKLITR
jgi:ribose transport system ATP-binding protein